MKKVILTKNLYDGNSRNENIDLSPNCPVCGVSLSPTVLYSALVEDDEYGYNNKAFVLNFCPECEECFISRHTYDENVDLFELHSSAPLHFEGKLFSPNITNLSAEFVNIYNDALHAESLGMTSICGMGYRKALEFLVKDYAISNNPDSEELISTMPLAKCINEYITDDRLKTLAKASTWLGNDETHYVRKHSTYGIEELKLFINAFITFIDSDLAYKEAQAFLSSK